MRRLLWLLALPALAQADRPAGEEITNAVMIDISEDGFAVLSDVLPALVPLDFPVADVNQGGSIDFIFFSLRWDLWVTNLNLGIEVVDAQIYPGDGILYVDMDLSLALNDSGDPANILAEFAGLELADCDTWIAPFPLTISTTLDLDVIDGSTGRYLDATVGDIAWDIGLSSSHLNMDCWIGDIEDVLDQIGIDLIGLLLDLARGPIDGIVQDLGDTIETTVEDAFGNLNIEQEIALLDATLYLAMEPDEVVITYDGMRLSMAGAAWSDPHPCVAENGITGSLITDYGLPPIATAPASIGGPVDLGVLADDDFVNQLLFAAYYGGGLCIEMSGADGSLPINTALLGALSPTLNDLFPEPVDLTLATRPTEPPVATADGDHDVEIDMNGFGIDFYGDVDYRTALVLGVDLDVNAGIDLEFDGGTGALAILVALGDESITPHTRHNEFAPGEDDAIAASMGGLVNSLLDPILGSALDGLAFNLPAISGVGVTSLDAAASGPGGDWIGFYGTLGNVSYGGAGCGDGCGGSGCTSGGGCNAANAPAQTLLAFLPIIGILLRRRSRR